MLNYIWASMCIIAMIFGIFSNSLDGVTIGALDGAKNGCMLALELCGVMCLWSGLLRIAEKSGLIQKVKFIFMPIMRFCFPRLAKTDKAIDLICMNMTANLLGMNNAATPLGLAAMKELDKLNKKSPIASDEMCMLVLINTASIAIFPTTVLALRAAAGSNPGDILLPVWITSIAAAIVGIVSCRLASLRKKGL